MEANVKVANLATELRKELRTVKEVNANFFSTLKMFKAMVKDTPNAKEWKKFLKSIEGTEFAVIAGVADFNTLFAVRNGVWTVSRLAQMLIKYAGLTKEQQSEAIVRGTQINDEILRPYSFEFAKQGAIIVAMAGKDLKSIEQAQKERFSLETGVIKALHTMLKPEKVAVSVQKAIYNFNLDLFKQLGFEIETVFKPSAHEIEARKVAELADRASELKASNDKAEQKLARLTAKLKAVETQAVTA